MAVDGEPLRAPLAGAVLVLSVLACHRQPPASSPPLDAGAASRVTAAPQVSLNLPSGWLVSAGADGVVRASGPRGQPVLRAEVQRGVGLPTADTLRTGFLGGLRHLRERTESVSEGNGFIAMRFVLADVDGGTGETEALLSATAWGEDTLLCASLRGATHEELDVVEKACLSAAPGR